MKWWRRKEIIISVIVGLLIFAYGAWYRSGPLYWQFDSGVPDDAAYYLKPALHAALGNGSSFDGIEPTNGYQPLWFLTLAGFLRTLPLESMSLYDVWQAALLLQALIAGLAAAAATYLIYRLTSNIGIAVFFASLPMLLIPGRILNLLETPLQILVFMVLLIQLQHLLERPAREDFRGRLLHLGLTTGALFLARTDGIFMLAALLPALVYKFQRDLIRLVWFVLPTLCVVGLYWLSNYLTFGVPMPVSGSIKMDQTHILMAQHAGWDFIVQKLKFILGPHDLLMPAHKVLIQIAALGIPLAVVAQRLRGKILSNRALVAFSIGSFLLLKYLGYVTIYHGSRTSAYWYWIVDAVAWCVIAAIVIRLLLERWVEHRYVVFGQKMLLIVALVALLGSYAYHQNVRAHETKKPIRDTSVLLDLADFLGRHDYFADKRIGSFNSGILGYFSGRQVTNLDGLINSPEYAKIIGRGERERYIQENIDILVEYHSAYVNYYTGLGFTLYNVRDYILDPVPFNEESGDDYRIYVPLTQRPAFEKFLTSLRNT